MRRRLTDRDLTPDIIAHASRILRELYPRELGAEQTFESGGRHYVAVLERHFHPPGGPLKPWGPHKGVSTFEVVEDLAPVGTFANVSAAPSPGPFALGVTSRARLQGVHPDLVRVVQRAIAITTIDFTVVEGLRTKERQKQLLAQGKTQTLKSRHLTGHAVDLAPFAGGQIHWDWPRFRELAPCVQRAAKDCNVPIEWGGNWPGFPDGPHWQLPWSVYP